uniref:Glycosyltransferase n=1 Tax=viral metagenome TaxID=1070528 RepID=A0A6M3KSM2_9ZZZZ
MSFLTILTRVHPARPNCLARNIESVKSQTDNDVQHLLLRPEVEPNDVVKAGPLIHEAASRIEGRYVMQLPDDDRLCTPTFVADLKAATEEEKADMVIFRCKLGEWVCPPEFHWQARMFVIGYIAGQNGILKKEIYDGASYEWLLPLYHADFYYLRTASFLSNKIIWWDYIGIESQGVIGNNAGASEDTIQLKPTMETINAPDET